MRQRDYLDAVGAELSRLGAVDWYVDHGGRHDKLRITIGERTLSYTIPRSPSDHRAARNACSDLRRMIRSIH